MQPPVAPPPRPSPSLSSAPLSHWRQVTVLGLGLIGGSLVEALKKCLPKVRVVGVDRVEERPADACGALPLDEYVQVADSRACQAALAASDAVFLATPVEAIISLLPQVLGWVGPGTVVSDCGSTKRQVAQAADGHPRRARFVPAHPMAGALGSAAGARSDLFAGRPWVICGEGSDPAAVVAVEALVRLLGAKPERMSTGEHDRAVALTSHAPRVVASLVTALADRASAFGAAGPAFERLMRAAGGDPAIWSSILASNSDAVAQALREMATQLADCAAQLEAGKLERVLELMRSADAARACFAAERLGQRELE